ncbi:MAG TPA: hypothetical protein VFS08_14215 [Gemmatimonadaceae bacterium]|nr:hypothetical protein [Gemmatimonadaceae bacterium]
MASVYHYPPREELLRSVAGPTPRGAKLGSIVLAVLGLVVFVAGLFLAPDRAWRAAHFNWLFFTTVSSAGVMFVGVQRITTARWSRPVARFLEGYVAWLPVAWIILLLIVTVGQSHVFTWTHETPPVPEKRFYFGEGFFLLRVLGVYTLITLISLWYVWTSVRLDVGVVPEAGAGWARGLRERMRRGFGEERRELHSTHSLQGKLAVFLVILFAYGWESLSFDLSMSLSLHFQSTMYGWQFFMGGFLGMLAMWNLITRWWDRHYHLGHLVTETTYHDLGKLCFAFAAFWGYLTFGQYIIIWYGNLPEETHFFHLRLIHPWVWLTTAVGVLMFVVPFFGLMGKKPKIWAPWMIGVAICVTVGLWLHRYIEVYPSTYGEIADLPFGIWEIGVTLGFLGLWGLCYLAFMDAFPRLRIVMMSSPYRDEVQVPVDPKTMEPLPAHE